jgi:hypothetical protein
MLAVSDHPPPLADGIAVSASLLCLAHCLALPLLAASLPALGLFVTHSLLVHALLLGCGFRFDPAHHSEEFSPGIPI